MTDEEIIAKGFKPWPSGCREKTGPPDYDGGDVLLRDGRIVDKFFVMHGHLGSPYWRDDGSSIDIIGYHPKKPNKIVIPDGLPPEWAKLRAREISCARSSYENIMAHLIAMLEEEPIDEDLIEARRICAEDRVDLASDYLDGGYDSSEAIRIALAALKRGRELGKAGDQDHD